MENIVGVTGTESKVTNEQALSLKRLLKHLLPIELHHGDCVGADQLADRFARAFGIPVVIHPPKNKSRRAFCESRTYGDTRRVYAPLEYLERDRAIARAVEVLIALPDTAIEQLRSGTWATVRYAREYQKKVFVCLPNGLIEFRCVWKQESVFEVE